MDKDIKTQWVGALRSGEYTQGLANLKRRDAEGETSHCCLGVLCELYDKATGDDAWESNTVSLCGRLPYAHKGENHYPSDAVLEWASLWGDEFVNGGMESLASLNDGGKSFEEIANIIESSL